METLNLNNLGAIIIAGVAFVVFFWPRGGMAQTLLDRIWPTNGKQQPEPKEEPYRAPTAAPSIDDVRTRLEVVELASQASNEEWRMGVRRLIEQMEAAGIEPDWKPNGRLKMAAEGQEPVVRIYDLILSYFNNTDIEELRFSLGIPEGEISGPEKPQRVIRLIEYCKNRGRLGELVALCRSKRRHLDWPGVNLDS